MSEKPVLTIEDLRTYFYSRSKQAFVRSVDGVSLKINKGETLGIVGESGSGKSMTSLSIMGLVDGEPGVITGKVSFKLNGSRKDLLKDLNRYVKLNIKDDRIMERKMVNTKISQLGRTTYPIEVSTRSPLDTPKPIYAPTINMSPWAKLKSIRML